MLPLWNLSLDKTKQAFSALKRRQTPLQPQYYRNKPPNTIRALKCAYLVDIEPLMVVFCHVIDGLRTPTLTLCEPDGTQHDACT